MNVHSKIPSDIIGLTTPSPLSRRGFFMTASAAAAAGYTLAAGPVRAQVVTTDTKGLKVGDATVKVTGGDMPVYFARPEKAKNPPVILVGDGDLRPARIHQGRDAPSRQGRRLRHRAELLFPLGRGPHQDHRDAEADADRERQDRRRAVRRSRRHGGLGEVARRRHQQARHHGLLPRRPHRLALCGAQQEPQGRRRVLRHLVDPPEQNAASGRRARSSSRPR